MWRQKYDEDIVTIIAQAAADNTKQTLDELEQSEGPFFILKYWHDENIELRLEVTFQLIVVNSSNTFKTKFNDLSFASDEVCAMGEITFTNTGEILCLNSHWPGGSKAFDMFVEHFGFKV
jgi:hypothetical protein